MILFWYCFGTGLKVFVLILITSGLSSESSLCFRLGRKRLSYFDMMWNDILTFFPSDFVI